MTYDFAGSWSEITAHHSNLYGAKNSVEASVAFYIQHGATPSKIILGVPAYGRSFANTDGLRCSTSGCGGGSFGEGVYDYKVCVCAACRLAHRQLTYKR